MAASHQFSHALTRHPAQSAVNGIRAVDQGAPDIAELRREHAAYRALLAECGVTVTLLPELEAYPDSMFVEDPALVFTEGAILLRPGAASRFGETAEIAPDLRALFSNVIALQGPGFSDGGDVMVTDSAVYIGLSARTDQTGAEELAAALESLGKTAIIVTPPPGVLHLKTACSMLDGRTVLATRQVAESNIFKGGLDIVVVPDGEEAVANALRVNDYVLIAQGFPKTAALLAARGYKVRTTKLTEVMKLDAGLSCMSLRWRQA